MLLSRFPRLHFAHLPTPLEPMDQLSKALGGPRLWVKRDDCTGPPAAVTKPASWSSCSQMH